jgi:fumarate hydratase subunit alpha
MRIIPYNRIVDTVKEMCIKANYNLPSDVKKALQQAIKNENSPLAISILGKCVENADIAKREAMPICQDTGLAVFFVKYGIDVQIEGKSKIIYDAINEGISKGYTEGYLRASSLSDPLFDRKNSGDNTPAVIHLELVPGDTIDITLAPKGGGAENMSTLKMLPPSAGTEGVINFVLDTVINAGGNPCPPSIIGIGIGGTFEKVAFLAKKALLWPLGATNQDPRYAALEKELLKKINSTGIGPQGLGGHTTCLSLHIEHAPCHLASLPVACNINCHVHRHMRKVL